MKNLLFLIFFCTGWITLSSCPDKKSEPQSGFPDISVKQSSSDHDNSNENNLIKEGDVSIQYYQDILKKAELRNDTFQLKTSFDAYNSLGDLSLSTDNELKAAYGHLNQARIYAERENNLHALSEIYFKLSSVLEEKGDLTESLAMLKKYYDVSDSLFSLEKDKQLGDIKERHETDRIEQDIIALNQESLFKDEQIRVQRILIWVFAFGIAIISFFGILLYFQNKKQTQTNIDLVRINLEIVEQEKLNVKRIKEIEELISFKKRELENNANNFSQRLSALCLETELILEETDQNDYKEACEQLVDHGRKILQIIAPDLTPESPNSPDYEQKNNPEGLMFIVDDERELVRKIIDIMENTRECLEFGFSLERLSSLVGSSKREVSAIINKKFGVGFNSFVNEYRIKEARQMLSSTEFENYTIEAIAGEVGFKSKSSFNSYFKKLTGLTPSFFQKTVKMATFNVRKSDL